MFDISQEEDYRELTLEEQYLVNGGERIENSDAAVAAGSPGDVLTRNDGSEVVITQGDITAAQKKLGLTGSGGNPGEGSGGYSGGPSGSPQSPSETKQAPDLIQDSNPKNSQNSNNSKNSYSAYFLKEDGAWIFGHALGLIYYDGKYFMFEINSINENVFSDIIEDMKFENFKSLSDNGKNMKSEGLKGTITDIYKFIERSINKNMRAQDANNYFVNKNKDNKTIYEPQPAYTVNILSVSETKFPTKGTLSFFGSFDDIYSGCIMRTFDTKQDAMSFLTYAGYDSFVKFHNTDEQNRVLIDYMKEEGTKYKDYNLVTNNCGTFIYNTFTLPGTGLQKDDTFYSVVPCQIDDLLKKSNSNTESGKIGDFY